jgi:hypothetical protein
LNFDSLSTVAASLPKGIACRNVASLGLHSNRLVHLDRQILMQFYSLTHLDLSSNQIESISGIGACLPWLQTLNLANNNVCPSCLFRVVYARSSRRFRMGWQGWSAWWI